MAADTRRLCSSCGKHRQARFFVSDRGRICTTCQKAKRRASSRAGHVRRVYDLTPEQHDALLERQAGACGICRGVRPYNLAVDHDHGSGLVRGLLCKRCNKLLRDVRDSQSLLDAALRYLNRTPAEAIGIYALHEDHR